MKTSFSPKLLENATHYEVFRGFKSYYITIHMLDGKEVDVCYPYKSWVGEDGWDKTAPYEEFEEDIIFLRGYFTGMWEKKEKSL